MSIDDLDRKIIAATQAGLPLTPQPYHAIARQLGVEVTQVQQKIRQMQAQGIIRRIGLIPNHYRLGYCYNAMTVWDIDDKRIDALGNKIGQLAFVSHCYHRPRHLPDWRYNLFAMLHSRTQTDIDRQIAIIEQILAQDNRGFDILYSDRILKKTGLRLPTIKTASGNQLFR